MFYGKSGELLIVNGFYETRRAHFFTELKQPPSVDVLCARTYEILQIPHNEVVMALEASVPPWHKTDRIRCLWGERVVHILRTALEKTESWELLK